MTGRLQIGIGGRLHRNTQGLRIFLHRARELAEREGPDGSLYKKRPKWSSTPTSKDLL
ncbi:hypothetical protein [Pararhizobium sp. LjRoot238]|uniref:hypothetical protein n=1 Tax=Pararhizobium sp. LjRoot238 TaxID=3342293 RepID=UPI003ECFA51C